MEQYNHFEEEEEEYDVEPNRDHSLPSVVKMQILNYDDDVDSTESYSTSNMEVSSQTMKSVSTTFNPLNYGTLPSSQKLEKVFQRLICQLDFLKRTANMMTNRMDMLQKEIDELKVQNNVE